MDNVNLKIADFFKYNRLKTGFSLEALAEGMNVPVETLIAYENGSKKIPLEDIYAFSNCLDIEPDKIVHLLYGLVHDQMADSSETITKIIS